MMKSQNILLNPIFHEIVAIYSRSEACTLWRKAVILLAIGVPYTLMWCGGSGQAYLRQSYSIAS